MAAPRVFVSSTYYDLKHVRSSLDIFVESLGFDSILSEKGDIAYSPDMPLDESCYREVVSADIFVLIIGGRYGSEGSDLDKKDDSKRKKSKEFFERYESVTKKEFEEAIKRDIPTYVLVEQSVYSEYHTYLKNKDNEKITYAHVDSVNIFKFIEQILSLPRNNPTQTFEKFSDIEYWLKEQWSGLFRELLRRMSEQKKFAELSQQVEGLKDINNTLKTYLESLMKSVSPEESSRLIESESQRLEKEIVDRVKENPLVDHLHHIFDIDINDIVQAIKESPFRDEFVNAVSNASPHENAHEEIESLLKNHNVISDLNRAREQLGLPYMMLRRRQVKRRPVRQSRTKQE